MTRNDQNKRIKDVYQSAELYFLNQFRERRSRIKRLREVATSMTKCSTSLQAIFNSFASEPLRTSTAADSSPIS